MEYNLDRIEMKQEEADGETGGINRLDMSTRSQNHCIEIIEQVSWKVSWLN